MDALIANVSNVPLKVRKSLNWEVNSEEYSFFKQKKFTCQMCSLKSRPSKRVKSGYMEIVTMNDEQVCLCTLCAFSQTLNRKAEGSMEHGTMIYCTDFNQTELMQFCTRAFVAVFREGELAFEAGTLLTSLKVNHAGYCNEVFPDKNEMSVSEYVGHYLNLSPEQRNRTDSIFKGMLYIPNDRFFEEQISYYSVAAFEHLDDDISSSIENILEQ